MSTQCWNAEISSGYQEDKGKSIVVSEAPVSGAYNGLHIEMILSNGLSNLGNFENIKKRNLISRTAFRCTIFVANKRVNKRFLSLVPPSSELDCK